MAIPILNLPNIQLPSEMLARNAQIAQSEANTDYTRQQTSALEQDQMLKAQQMQQKAALEQLTQEATKNPQALQALANVSPERASQIQEFQNNQALRLGQAAQAFKMTNRADKPQVYQQTLRALSDQGFDISELPAEYDPKLVDAKVDFAINSARDIEKQITQQVGKQTTKAEDLGGATGILVQRYMDSTGSNFPDALAAVQGLSRKGLEYDEQGNVITRKGFIESQGALKEAESKGQASGKFTAGTVEEFKSQSSKLPDLQNTVKELGDLGKKATYTKAGQARDALLRQTGRPMSEGGIARAKYIAMVDNQILPLLKDTFGAAFTVQEGESLRATLGDPNVTPAEKKAKLDAFIKQKTVNLNATKRKLGIEGSAKKDMNFASGKVGDISWEVVE